MHTGYSFRTVLLLFFFTGVTASAGTWERMDTPFSSVEEIAINTQGDMFALTRNTPYKLYRCLAGQSWEEMSLPVSGTDIQARTLILDHEGRMFLSFSNYQQKSYSVYRSTDRGEHWTQNMADNDPKPGTDWKSYRPYLALAPNDDLYIVSSLGVRRTQDGGEHWVDVPTAGLGGVGSEFPPVGYEINHLSIDEAGYLLFSTKNKSLFILAPGSTEWESHQLPLDQFGLEQGVMQAVRYSDGTLVANGTSSTYRSVNGGQSWTKTEMSGGVAGYMHRLPDGALVYGAGGGVFMSTTAGAAWERIATYQQMGYHLTDAETDAQGKLYIATEGGIYTADALSSVGEERPAPYGALSPNPFHLSAIIDYSVAHAGPVEVTVYSSGGIPVATLVSQEQSIGTYQAVWSSEGYAAGAYYCIVRTHDGLRTFPMIKTGAE